MSWKSVCGAAQGRGHAKNGVPCQDKTARRVEGKVHVIALADGAGSARLSHYGAERVVERVAAFVADRFYELIEDEDGAAVKQKILSVALRTLENEATVQECELRDLASTLLLAAADDERFLLAHLGDGVIGYLSEKGLKAASTPDNGEFANETIFVTSKGALNQMRIFKGTLGSICGFILMSDGSEQSLYHKRDKTLAEGARRLMHRTCLIAEEVLTPQLEQAIESVLLENTQDDCSLAIMARTSKLLPPLRELSLFERKNLYGIGAECRNLLKRIRRLDEICELLSEPLTLKQISSKLYLKRRYVAKKLKPLIEAGLVVREGTRHRMYCD